MRTFSSVVILQIHETRMNKIEKKVCSQIDNFDVEKWNFSSECSKYFLMTIKVLADDIERKRNSHFFDCEIMLISHHENHEGTVKTKKNTKIASF